MALTRRPLEPIERPVPDPGPGQVLLAVRACAVCRTDLHVVKAASTAGVLARKLQQERR